MNEKIDFVIIWVDGNDPKWLQEKEKYMPKREEDGGENRYRDWDNLQYWFRGVEKFAPWVNKIHFVTWGHLPKWLNVSHPRLNIVWHEDYIPKEYLPTFNSHTIELNLHRIKGLSEQFVYFNDDMFITDYIEPEIFFKNNLPRDFAVLSDVCTNCKDDLFVHIVLNTIGLINENFNKQEVMQNNLKRFFNLKYPFGDQLKTLFFSQHAYFTPFYNHHLPSPFLKSTLQEVWDKEREVLHETSQHRFRNIRDVSQYIFRYWQLAEGRFLPISRKQLGQAFPLKADNHQLYEAIRQQRYKMICINDSVEILAFEKQKEELKECFVKLLPHKCSFEI